MEEGAGVTPRRMGKEQQSRVLVSLGFHTIPQSDLSLSLVPSAWRVVRGVAVGSGEVV